LTAAWATAPAAERTLRAAAFGTVCSMTIGAVRMTLLLRSIGPLLACAGMFRPLLTRTLLA
jgi:hypothetical protein